MCELLLSYGTNKNCFRNKLKPEKKNLGNLLFLTLTLNKNKTIDYQYFFERSLVHAFFFACGLGSELEISKSSFQS